MRKLSLLGSTIRNDKGEVTAILFTLIDATSLEKMEKENLRHKVLVRLLKEIDSFKDFTDETRTRLKLCRQFVQSGEQGKTRGELHTMKGNTAAYDMIEIAKLIHHIEDAPKIEAADIDRIEAAYVGFLETNFDVLQMTWSGDGVENYTVSKIDLESLVDRVRSSAGADAAALAELTQWATNIQFKSARSLIGALPDYGERLASRLGKPCKIRVDGGDVKMNPDVMRPIMQSLVHLIRNSIDHGLEAPYERGDKPEEGLIAVNCIDAGSDWIMTIVDDGKGIDIEHVIKKAISSGQISSAQVAQMSQKEKFKLVLMNGLSTSETVSEISGRGVGMGAVVSSVQDAGGILDVESEIGKGTKVSISVPKFSRQNLRRAA